MRIAAADRVYKVKKLRPIHANCKCTVAPVTTEHDPGDELNKADLQKLYDEAGGTLAAHLKRTRYRQAWLCVSSESTGPTVSR